MSKRDLQKDIRNNEEFILSEGTLNINHLLAKAYDLMVAYNLRPNIYGYIQSKSIYKEIQETFNAPKSGTPSLMTDVYYGLAEIPREKEEYAFMLWDDITSYFQELAPSGYYFGESEGNSSCIGWFRLV